MLFVIASAFLSTGAAWTLAARQCNKSRQQPNTGFNYPDFSSVTGLNLVGSASQIDNSLRLTPNSGNRRGTAWHETKQYIQDGFETIFQFQITDLGYGGGCLSYPPPGADGFAFVIQNHSDQALGLAACNIGYTHIANSLAIEFDTWANNASGGFNPIINDPNGNHISAHTRGIDSNSASHQYSLGSTTLIPDMSDEITHTTKIEYVPDTIKIYLDDLTTPVLTVAVDISSTLDLDEGRAWVGFTSGTGCAWENHDILSWSFTTDVADLSITKTDSPDPVTVGNNLTYTVAVTNQGPTTVTEVTLTDTLPLGVIFGSVTPSQGSCSGTSIITCTFGTVANGDSVIIEIVVTPTAAGVITNTAIVMGNAYDPDTSNNIIAEDTTVSNVVPSVIVENTLTEHNCSAGVVTFTITVTNTGPSELDKIPLYYEYDPYYLDFIASSLTISEPVQHGRLDWCDLTASEPNGFNENLRSGERFTVTLDFGVVRDITRTVTTAVVTGVIDINDNPANEYRDDAQVENVPTAVELLYFWATLRPGAVLLEWETVIEVDNFGFYLLRSASNRLEGAQEIAFVPAAAYGSSGGAAYSFKDLDVQAGSTYSYWLVDIDTSGQRTVHRPITVTITSKADSAYRLYLPVITR